MRKPVFTDFLPGATPTTKEPIRSGPVQGPQKPSIANIIAPKLTAQDREKYAKRDAAAKAKKSLKTVRIGNDVYDYEFTGWDTLTTAQKKKAMLDAQADIIANDPTADKKAFSPYEEVKPFTGGDAVKAVANQVLGTAPGVQAANAVASTPIAAAGAEKLRGVAKSINVQVPKSNIYDQEGVQMLADLTINAPSQTVGAAADFLDPKTDNIGRVSTGLQLGASVLGGAQAVKAGKKAFDLARKTGSFGKALLNSVGAAIGENIGISGPDAPVAPKQTLDAQFDLTPTRPVAQVADATPTAPTSFADQQRAMLRDVLGADDVSGVTGTFRQPISKMPENRIESLSPQGRALESWAGANLQKLLDNGVGEDLRTWDAVGKHYGAGAVPRNAEDFDLWLNDLVRTVDENDRSISAIAESYGRGGDLNADLVALRDARGKSRMRKDTGVVALVPQGRGYRQTANSAWVPLSDVPMHLRRTIMDRVGSSETRFTSRNNYQAWVDAGKPEGGVLRPRMADEYMMDSFGGDSTMDDFILNPPKEAMVPRWAISDEIKNLASRYTEAGQASAAMRKPIMPQDFDDAVRYYNGEPSTNVPVVEPTPTPKVTPTSQESRQVQPLQPQPTAVQPPTPVGMAPTPKMADMTPREPSVPTVTATADAPQNVTGISNAANLSDFEQGILSSAPEGKGRSVKEIYETNRNRKDFDNVADRVSKGEALTADNAAAILAGKAEYTAKVRSAKDAIEQGIVDGVSEVDMTARRKALDDAIEAATEYAEKIQRGKSEWSDVGRTLAAYIDVDTRDIASVLQEARIRKGAALTAEEIAKREAEVKALKKVIDDSKAEIERLMKAHADNATKVAAARKIVRTPEARAAKRKQALDEFFAASSGLNAYVNPKVIKQFAKYMYTLIEDGARSVDDIVAAAAKDGVKADFEDVYAAMRSQVKESTLSDLQKEIAKTKRDLMAAAKADTPEAKAAAELKLRTKAEIDAWNQAERAKAKEEADILRNLKADSKGLTKEQRAARQKELDEALGNNAKADNLRQQIVKLLEQAEDGTLPAPKKKEIDARVQALEIERRKALKAAQDASPEYQAAKDARLTQSSKKRLEEKLKALEERIANKDYAEVSIVKNARRTDSELDLLRQKIRVKESMVKAGIEAMRPRSGADKVGNFLNEIKLLNPASRLKDFTANSVKGADFVAFSILRRGVDWTTSKILGELPITKGTNVDRTQRVLAKAKNRMIADAELIAKGADPDSIKKYGSYKGIGGKAAGLTDVPFKSYYYEWMQDAAADYKARKALGKGATPEAIATKREEILANIDEHPDIQLMAEEYSLNQTFNNSNWASESVGFWKRKANGAGKVAIDEFIGRFAKVITNVATDATDRTGIGVLRGGKKILDAKMLGQSLSVSERAIINDMITKGATGMATLALGYFLGDKIPGTIKGERGKYVDFGDLESIGGPISPLLLGAIYKKAESIDDPEQAAGLRLASVLRLPINTPLASNSKDLLNALTDSSSTQGVKKLLARKISNVFIPGGVRDIAERMDSNRGLLTGSEVEREKIPKEINPKTNKEVQTKNFLEILKGDVKSKIPFVRQTLPIKKSDADKKKEKAEAAAKKKLNILK